MEPKCLDFCLVSWTFDCMILVPPLGAYGELLHVQDHADIPYAAPLYFTDIKVSVIMLHEHR